MSSEAHGTTARAVVLTGCNMHESDLQKLATDTVRPKQVIAQIIRFSGGDLTGRIRLCTAFYLAHLFYAREQVDYLSDWPFLKTEDGPAPADLCSLLRELEDEGVIEVRTRDVGPFRGERFRTLKDSPLEDSNESIDALKKAVRYTKNLCGPNESDLCDAILRSYLHGHSRSWRCAEEGDDLNIYIDLLTETEYAELMASTSRLSSLLSDVRESRQDDN